MRLLDDPIVESEDLAGDVEHALDDGVEREVLAHLVLVDSVLFAPHHGVGVAPVPRLDRLAVKADPGGERVEVGANRRVEGGEQLLVEGSDPRRVLRHLELHGVVGPGGLAEDLGDSTPQLESFLEQRPVVIDRLAPVLVEQRPPQLSVVPLLEERKDLRVVEAHAEGGFMLSGAQPLDVRVAQAVELLPGDVDAVAELVEVPLERNLDLDEAVSQRFELVSLGPVQLLPCAAEVAQPVLQETRPLPAESLSVVCRGECTDRLEQVAAEGDGDPPFAEALLRIGAGVAHIGIGVDLSHECADAIGPHEVCPGKLERQQGGVERWRRRDGTRHERVGIRDGGIGRIAN